MAAPELVRVSRVDAAIRGAGIVSVFQPIVELSSSQTLGYEALSRWPGTGLEPSEVFAAATANGRLAELDLACLRSALTAASRSRLPSGSWLFVNVEPQSLPGAAIAIERHQRSVHRSPRIVIELTERALLEHPAGLLANVARIRATGAKIALDDVGVHRDSVASLDLLMPDIIKLDLSLVQMSPTPAQARALAAIMAHSERTGAVVLAEGIENDVHIAQALACGASIGQGFALGRPGPLPLPGRAHENVELIGVSREAVAVPRTPFDLADAGGAMRVSTKDLLLALSHHVEAQAGNAADPPVVLTALQHARWFTDRTRRTYQRLAETSPLVAVFGQDLTPAPGGLIRGVDLDAADDLAAEWTVVALGPQTAVALIARDHNSQLGRDDALTPDKERQFNFCITYDRAVVTQAARSLLTRLN